MSYLISVNVQRIEYGKRKTSKSPSHTDVFFFTSVLCHFSVRDLKHPHILPWGHPDLLQLAAVPSDQTG